MCEKQKTADSICCEIKESLGVTANLQMAKIQFLLGTAVTKINVSDQEVPNF